MGVGAGVGRVKAEGRGRADGLGEYAMLNVLTDYELAGI